MSTLEALDSPSVPALFDPETIALEVPVPSLKFWDRLKECITAVKEMPNKAGATALGGIGVFYAFGAIESFNNRFVFPDSVVEMGIGAAAVWKANNLTHAKPEPYTQLSLLEEN